MNTQRDICQYHEQGITHALKDKVERFECLVNPLPGGDLELAYSFWANDRHYTDKRTIPRNLAGYADTTRYCAHYIEAEYQDACWKTLPLEYKLDTCPACGQDHYHIETKTCGVCRYKD